MGLCFIDRLFWKEKQSSSITLTGEEIVSVNQLNQILNNL